ncbi:MAG: hypothetical protein ISR58_09700 [Anaerolineales bacterium]|nr:hypothetical protein [Chloroflexota bacterium]MBL6981448.1 hypothetical protein [Anaerolineales bacterium]
MNFILERFIGENIEVQYDKPPTFEKTPGCPDRFFWDGLPYTIIEMLSQWHDFSRSGSMAHNMRPSSMKKARRRGSYGVGRFYFRVRTKNDRFFEIYYDRAVKSVDDRKGEWVLLRELSSSLAE